MTRWTDRLLDQTVILSFDRSGFRRHSARFDPAELSVDLSGQTALVTGANSGIGFETARALARRGAEVWLLCRSRERGEAAVGRLRAEQPAARLHLCVVDVASLASVGAAAASLPSPVHLLIHNAGVLPDQLSRTAEGLESTLATNLVGPFLLTALLLPALRAAGEARVILVSSGGMYAEKLDVARLSNEDSPFDGVKAYARTKRAQVVLGELWQAQLGPRGIDVYTMHPGWADTPAVATSIPTFHRLTRAILRSPAEGADTVIWLAIARRLRGQGGRFWFDREAVSPHLSGPAGVLRDTREGEGDRAALWAALHRWSGLEPAIWGPPQPPPGGPERAEAV
jgi:dehydrogenase/reductase SDR family protein 12